MSPSQNPRGPFGSPAGGPFKGFNQQNTPAAAAPRQARPVAVAAAARPSGQSNTLAIVALILSILGLGCPIVGLTGAILGIVAMRTSRSGMAIAAVIIGSLTTLLVAVLLIVSYSMGFTARDSSVPYADATDPSNPAFVRQPTLQEAMRFTEIQANEVARLVIDFNTENNRLPEDLTEVTAQFGRVNDGWGTEYMLSVESVKPAADPSAKEITVAFILTAGPDRTWGTADDYVAASAPYVNLDEYGMKSRP